jgi:hypothetical protein
MKILPPEDGESTFFETVMRNNKKALFVCFVGHIKFLYMIHCNFISGI